MGPIYRVLGYLLFLLIMGYATVSLWIDRLIDKFKSSPTQA